MVVSLVGYTAAFVVDLATFVVCAVTVALLPIPGGAGGKDTRPDSEGIPAGVRGRGGRAGGGGRARSWRRPPRPVSV